MRCLADDDALPRDAAVELEPSNRADPFRPRSAGILEHGALARGPLGPCAHVGDELPDPLGRRGRMSLDANLHALTCTIFTPAR